MVKQYKRDRIIKVLLSLGFVVQNPKSDAPVYFLYHQKSDIIVAIDKYPDRFPEDYVKEKMQSIMDFELFRFLYEKSKTEKK